MSCAQAPFIPFNYDMDMRRAPMERMLLLEKFAAERQLVKAYYSALPALGHVEALGFGFRWHPVDWRGGVRM